MSPNGFLNIYDILRSSTVCCTTYILEGAYLRAINGAVVDLCTAQNTSIRSHVCTSYSSAQMEHTQNVLFLNCSPRVVALITSRQALIPILKII